MFEDVDQIVRWLEEHARVYDFDVIGLARRDEKPPYPLPTEPGTLANILETTAVDQLTGRLARDSGGVQIRQGGQRTYPDMELQGGMLGDHIVALDVKVARRAQPPMRGGVHRTQSRISLLTGDTFFARPDQPHPGSIMRPYNAYWHHLDWIMLFDIDVAAARPEVTNIDHVIVETWRVASRQRSSRTRNYIGAVTALRDLREKRGAFDSRAAFERYWRDEYTDWRQTPPRETTALTLDPEGSLSSGEPS